METFVALLGLIGLAGVPIAIGVLIYSLVKKNKAIKFINTSRSINRLAYICKASNSYALYYTLSAGRAL